MKPSIPEIKSRLTVLEAEIKLLKKAVTAEARKTKPPPDKRKAEIKRMAEKGIDNWLKRIHKHK